MALRPGEHGEKEAESVARDLLFGILARRFGEEKVQGQAASASEFRVSVASTSCATVMPFSFLDALESGHQKAHD